MKKIAFLLMELVSVSCSEEKEENYIDNIPQGVSICVDSTTYEHILNGEKPVDVFLCKDCGLWHILFEGYDYD